MKIKSYFASSVEAAIATARKELGADAMLMNSRKAMPEARHLGDYEVVFAIPDATEKPEPEPARGDDLASELAELRRHIQQMSLNLQRASTVAANNFTEAPSLAEVFARLTAAEVDASLAHRIIAALRSRPHLDTRIEHALRDELNGMVSVLPELGRPSSTRSVVAFIGPPGVGKTTTLVKLAVREGIAKRKSTQILTMDLERIAAADQLHSLSAIIGAGFQAVETSQALSLALEEHRNKDLILIDTPGYGPKDLANTSGHVEMLSRHAHIDVHLVLSAATKPADLARMSQSFSGFRPHKLLFTHLDETTTFGPLLNESVRTGRPISFLGTGQQIPEDLEPATRTRILDLLAGTASASAAIAAA